MSYETVKQIQQANKDAGHYHFSGNTMRYFNSIVHGGVYGGKFFVMSNKQPSDREHGIVYPRLYTVYVVDEFGEVYSVDGHEDLRTLTKAKVHAMKLAAEDVKSEVGK